LETSGISEQTANLSPSCLAFDGAIQMLGKLKKIVLKKIMLKKIVAVVAGRRYSCSLTWYVSD
jgi:hypothetical protein